MPDMLISDRQHARRGALLQQATEFLASARRHKPGDLSPAAAERQLHDARRLVGQLASELSGPASAAALAGQSLAVLSPDDFGLLGQVFADAMRARRAGDLPQAARYAALRTRISQLRGVGQPASSGDPAGRAVPTPRRPAR